MEDKKGITITDAFQNISTESIRKPKKIWEDKGSWFYNKMVKLWLQDNHTEMYLTHNEGKKVNAERFVRTFKNKACKYITLVSKNGYIHKLRWRC